jgi:hypothetical protein
MSKNSQPDPKAEYNFLQPTETTEAPLPKLPNGAVWVVGQIGAGQRNMAQAMLEIASQAHKEQKSNN